MSFAQIRRVPSGCLKIALGERLRVKQAEGWTAALSRPTPWREPTAGPQAPVRHDKQRLIGKLDNRLRSVEEPAIDVGATRKTVREVGARAVVGTPRLRPSADVTEGIISSKEDTVARSDLLKQLFAAHSRADDASFRDTAARLIADERRLGHRLLAADLEHALRRDAVSSMTDSALTMRALPRGRDERPLLAITKPSHELSDLVLSEDCRVTIAEIVEENRNRSLLSSYRLLPRRRLLFIGAPGTGKTASAQAVAAELSLPVATVSLSALMSSFLGETAKNVEAVLNFAELTPCVLVFDEFDAISADRATPNDHGEMRRVMATVLQLIERVQGESVVIATSNHPHLLDTAMWRRFDEVVTFGSLPPQGIELLLKMRLQGVQHRLRLHDWAKSLSGLTPAEIELIALDAQRRWVLSGRKFLSDEHLRTAIERRALASAGRHAQQNPTSST